MDTVTFERLTADVLAIIMNHWSVTVQASNGCMWKQWTVLLPSNCAKKFAVLYSSSHKCIWMPACFLDSLCVCDMDDTNRWRREVHPQLDAAEPFAPSSLLLIPNAPGAPLTPISDVRPTNDSAQTLQTNAVQGNTPQRMAPQHSRTAYSDGIKVQNEFLQGWL